jgi:hypothetical protein
MFPDVGLIFCGPLGDREPRRWPRSSTRVPRWARANLMTTPASSSDTPTKMPISLARHNGGPGSPIEPPALPRGRRSREKISSSLAVRAAVEAYTFQECCCATRPHPTAASLPLSRLPTRLLCGPSRGRLCRPPYRLPSRRCLDGARAGAPQVLAPYASRARTDFHPTP